MTDYHTIMASNSIHTIQDVQNNDPDLEKVGTRVSSPAISTIPSHVSAALDTIGYGKIAEIMQSDNGLLM